jgi:hypothetical protein
MVERIVMLKLVAELADEQGRAEVARVSVQRLAEVPGVVEVFAGLPADAPSAGSWDLMLRLRFHALADLEAYVDHPVHVRFLEDYLKPRLTFRKVWNFRTM